jgi:predicted enzyme related to lactoylglutathione lyase
MIKGMDVASYITAEPQRSIAFYRDVLGIAPTHIDDQGRGAEFTLADGTTFGVWKPDASATNGGIIMFAVDDIQADVAEFRKRGAGLSDPLETPVCFMSFGQDPDGNAFMVHQRKSD